ncbi:MAG: DNA internalization-related competence protein ComEC/Rec2, partial [Cyclonatronaceae bacterium]
IAFARLFQRRRDAINLTGLAAFLMLLADPQALFQIGFQMSFAAVLTIFVMLPLLERLFPPAKRNRSYARLAQLTLLSVCIQAALMPVLLHRFNEFSLIGPIMNTIAAPLTQIMFLAGFAAVFMSMIQEAAGTLAGFPADFIAQLLRELTQYAARLPGAFVQARLPSLWVYPLWAGLFGFMATLLHPALRMKWLIFCLVMALGWQASTLMQKVQPPSLKLTFFDVGQGDALLIQTPLGNNYLYDTGVWTPYGNSGERVLIPHLKAEGISRLDGIFLSHPHADHIGGLLPLIQDPEISISRIYDSGFEVHSAIFSGYRVAAREQEIPVEVLQAGAKVWLDELTPAFIMGPSPGLRSQNPNEHSLVMQIHYGEQQVLLTGDAEAEAELFLQHHYGELLESEIYKAGHHGSRSSSLRPFIEQIKPEKVIVSNGLENRYGHPHPEAVRRLRASAEHVRYTALEGAVQIEVWPEEFTLRPWRSRLPVLENQKELLEQVFPQQ